jgi:hypothetical protein
MLPGIDVNIAEFIEKKAKTGRPLTSLVIS